MTKIHTNKFAPHKIDRIQRFIEESTREKDLNDLDDVCSLWLSPSPRLNSSLIDLHLKK